MQTGKEQEKASSAVEKVRSSEGLGIWIVMAVVFHASWDPCGRLGKKGVVRNAVGRENGGM